MAYSGISKPSLHFNTKLYTGTGSSNSLTGVGFQPDWTWIKKRNGATNHMVVDSVRGVTKTLVTNSTVVEDTDANSLTAFGADGFTVGSTGAVNGNNDTFASWNWKANGAGSANTDGSTNSTVSVNSTAGFSIVKFSGDPSSSATIGHGLGVAPSMIITKSRGSTDNWVIYHKNLGASAYIELDNAGAKGTSGSVYRWNNTAPTNSVFSVGAGSGTNNSSQIAYCFAEKKGYSKFGYYEGNGSTNGRFVYTGFKPAFIIYKRYDSGSYNWVLVDNKRGAGDDELIKKYFHPDTSAAEGSTTIMDFLSNGFKLRIGDTTSNQGSIIFMAFAEEPLVANVGNSIPATAR